MSFIFRRFNYFIIGSVCDRRDSLRIIRTPLFCNLEIRLFSLPHTIMQ